MIASITAYWPIFEPFLLPIAVLMIKTIIQSKGCERNNDEDTDAPSHGRHTLAHDRMRKYYTSVFALLERQRQAARNSNFIDFRNQEKDSDDDIESLGSVDDTDCSESSNENHSMSERNSTRSSSQRPRSVSFGDTTPIS